MLRRRTEVSPFAPSAGSVSRAGQKPGLGPILLRTSALAAVAVFAAALMLVACSQLGGKPSPVEIVDPAGTIYTNGTVLVRVQVAGPAEENVELLVDGVAGGNPIEPLLWELDTTTLGEGEYSLVARAQWAGNVHSSEPRSLVVDRTAPTLLLADSRPPDKSMTARLRDPVVAVFSEPLDPGSVSEGSFTVSDPSGPLDLRLELSNDGRSLFAYHEEVPVLPTKVSPELSPELTDRAGNGLILPQAEWSWALLAWLLPGGEETFGAVNSYGAKVSLSAASDGRLFLAREEHVYKEDRGGTDYDVLVSVWDGSSWSQLGGPAEGDDPFLFGNEPSLTVLPDGTPVVAFYTWLDDGSIPPNEVQVSRWNGSSWLQLGEIEMAYADSSAYDPSLAAGFDGLPVVAYGQSELPGRITVQRWSGAEWEALGHPLGENAVSLVEIAVDDQNRPLLVWREDGLLQLARWQENDWTLLGGANSINPGSYATSPDVAALADGTPIVAWRDAADKVSSASRILVAKWDDSEGWQNVGELQLASGTPGTPSITPGTEGGAYISWPQSGEIQVAHWDGSRMRLLPGPVNEAVGTSGSEPDIAVADGIPVVAWAENDGVWVRSYNGLP